jgi:hypothetical protein
LDASTAPGLANLSSCCEHLLLDRHGLEHGFDDQVRVLDVLEPDHAVDQAHALGRRIGGNAAARRGRLVVLLHHAHAALELLLAGLDQRHRDTGIGERHRDAAAHGAGADDGDPLDIARLGALGNAGDLGRFALGEERITLRLRLVARHQLEEALALLLQPFIERQVDGGADRVGGGKRRFQPARLLGQGGDRVGEDRAVGLGRRELAVVVAQLAQRPLLGQHLAGKRLAAGGRAFDDFLDQAVLERLGALIGSPPTIILTASSGPTARGSRCVPPAPGSRPSFTSGRPSLASLVATRKWQASATSRPPPSAVP